MTKDTPAVFISHIHEERELAAAFKELIQRTFSPSVPVFVSSDESSVQMGEKWLDEVTSALQECALEVVVCSPKSVLRPWINFEAGAGWIRGIPVVPLCHSGMFPEALPLPLNLLQSARATEPSALRLVFPLIAQAIGRPLPRIDLDSFVAAVQDFEDRYLFWDKCNECLGSILRLNPRILLELSNGKAINLRLTESQMAAFQRFIPLLREEGVLDFQRTQGVLVNADGVYHGCRFTPLERFNETMDHSGVTLPSDVTLSKEQMQQLVEEDDRPPESDDSPSDVQPATGPESPDRPEPTSHGVLPMGRARSIAFETGVAIIRLAGLSTFGHEHKSSCEVVRTNIESYLGRLSIPQTDGILETLDAISAGFAEQSGAMDFSPVISLGYPLRDVILNIWPATVAYSCVVGFFLALLNLASQQRCRNTFDIAASNLKRCVDELDSVLPTECSENLRRLCASAEAAPLQSPQARAVTEGSRSFLRRLPEILESTE